MNMYREARGQLQEQPSWLFCLFETQSLNGLKLANHVDQQTYHLPNFTSQHLDHRCTLLYLALLGGF